MTSEWPAALPDPRSLRSVREDLLSRGLLAERPEGALVRPVIDRSWRRCVVDAVPTVRSALPHAELSTMSAALHDAAAPVVERMAEHLGDLRVGLYVSNDRGQILLRRVHDAQHRRVLDRACAAEGFDFSETSVGTNGMGTAIVERSPVLIHGAEHYSDLLEDVTCAATPVFEPFTHRLLGTFSLACATKDASRLMYGLTTDVGRQIESNLTTMLGAREQALIRAYLMAENASREPVLVITDRTVFANTAGVPHLDSAAHAVLWDHLSGQPLRGGTLTRRLPMSGGWRDALVEAVEGTHAHQPAFCIRLLPDRPADAEATRPGLTVPAAGLSSVRAAKPIAAAARTGRPDVAAALDGRGTLAVQGGPGTGKLHAARSLLAGAEPIVVDLSAVRPGDGAWSGSALAALDLGRPVVLRHVQDLHARDVNRVVAVANTAGTVRADCSLVLTWDPTDAPEHVERVVRRIAPVVRLPELAEDPSRVAELVEVMLEQLTSTDQRPRLSSDALQCLLRWSWPGNAEELRALLQDLCTHLPGKLVRQTDLPARLQRAPRRRVASLMESAERTAIVSALQQAQGNRSRAAQLLGIGRTTLYRKMQQLRIDG